MRKTFNHRILYGQMDDGGQSCQNFNITDPNNTSETLNVIAKLCSACWQVHGYMRYILTTVPSFEELRSYSV